ncbi:endo-1,4-beta-xylanase A precursor [Andreesenia angusta]|uniref:Endo-1,4-beta-xylanase A n=1 Tax=Andreesenia angusta TaxID=39480 RepID=A0A1S1V8G2_9FIRM|nr:S-layer homology domain-containing protein [Andreesenia angusta]OHW62695.1 endo-1,4-beta-xylanase A precursor [Andreesenia angusta]
MKRLANKAISAILAGTMVMSVPLVAQAAETGTTATDDKTEAEKEEEDRIKTLIERGESAGKSEAEALAERHAEVHFFSSQSADPTRDSLKSDAAIVAKYYLNYQEAEYRNAFLNKFKEYYPTAYTEKFISLEKENEEKLYERAKKDGSDMGKKAGSTRAIMDFVEGRTNSWQRAYNEFIAEESLDDRYFLYNEPSWYVPTFKDWFKAEFNANYTGTYMGANMETATGNMTYKKLSGLGDVITFQDTAFNIADGAVGVNKVKTVELSIPKAAFYNDTYIGIEKEKDSFGASSGKYKPVTNVYSVTVNNSEENVALREDLMLTFDYYGTDRVGIYEWADGKWRYLNTLQDEQREGQAVGLVSTIIPKGTDYSGGQYALFIDDDFSHFKDIQMSWAKEEIFSYLRRGYVLGYGDDTFKPERKITRGEFLIIASRIFDWDVKGSTANVYFGDKDGFGYYKDYVNYAASNGYVTGYPDGTFRPWDNISYSEIEWLMKRLIDDKNFNWKYFADIMKYEKYKYSPSNDNMNAKIMRDEAVFMFYTLEKQGRI